ncbi:MAG: hypothetical protein SR1Q7_09820 [Quinella sp. 1Q7]|nr:hypothetical protein [Quinella sp. 1Q7]
MATAGELEQQISRIEGFDATIKQGGKDVRSDKGGFEDWPYQKQSKDTMTVSKWISKFQTQYPGYDVEVSSGGNADIHGNTHLKNIR